MKVVRDSGYKFYSKSCFFRHDDGMSNMRLPALGFRLVKSIK